MTMASVETPPPVVCTLANGPLTQQKLEWTDLAAHAATRTAIEGGAESSYPLDLADQIESLADREVACCGSWLQIAHERDDHVIRLRLTTTNPEGVDLIRTMSGL